MNKIYITCSLCLIFGVGGGYLASENTPPESGGNKSGVDHSPRQPPRIIRQNTKFLEGSVTGKPLNDLLNRLNGKMTREEWKQAASGIIPKITGSLGEEKVLFLLFSKWADSDFEGALEEAMKLGPAYSKGIIAEIFAVLAVKDPDLAASYYQENRDALYSNDEVIGAIAAQWSVKSPEEAWSWLASLERKKRLQGMAMFFRGLHLRDNGEAEKYAALIPADDLRYEYIHGAITRDWAKADPDSAKAWVDTMPDSIKPYAQMELVLAAVSRDLEEATRELASCPEEMLPRLIYGMTTEIAGRYGDQAAAEWLIHDSPYKNDVQKMPRRVFEIWSRNDPAAAKKWTESLPEGELKEFIANIQKGA